MPHQTQAQDSPLDQSALPPSSSIDHARQYHRGDSILIGPGVRPGAQIATVLSHAHAIPVVHRDLKPDSVLVTDDGTVKVLDFGIAAILRRDITKITVTGSPMGTSRCMSPEQVDAAQVTPQSDLYALGCVLHELLSGAPVFIGDGQYELWKQHLTATPERLRELRSDVSPELEKLVLDLLAKKPEQRPADAYAVYERLLPFLPSPGSPAVATSERLGEMPDPTLLYRQPNAPRRRTRRQPPVSAPPSVPQQAEVAHLRPVRRPKEPMGDLAGFLVGVGKSGPAIIGA
ncbi:serine/threonine-protein kinase [Spirillospora sp. NPDC049024]